MKAYQINFIVHNIAQAKVKGDNEQRFSINTFHAPLVQKHCMYAVLCMVLCTLSLLPPSDTLVLETAPTLSSPPNIMVNPDSR